MAHRVLLSICAGACFALAACNSGPSSSGPGSSGKDETAVIERKIAHIEGLLARRSLAAAALGDLTSSLPGRAWLTEVAYDSGKVSVKGRAPSNNLVADYLSGLEGGPSLEKVVLRSSAMRTVRGRESQEFALEAAARGAGDAPAASDLPSAVRLDKLEKTLTTQQDTAGMIRDLQRLARDAGLQMTKFAPGAEVQGEFTAMLPVAIEVLGGSKEFGRYLADLAALPALWVVDRFSFKAVSADDPRSEIRASITARAYFAR